MYVLRSMRESPHCTDELFAPHVCIISYHVHLKSRHSTQDAKKDKILGVFLYIEYYRQRNAFPLPQLHVLQKQTRSDKTAINREPVIQSLSILPQPPSPTTLLRSPCPISNFLFWRWRSRDQSFHPRISRGWASTLSLTFVGTYRATPF